MNGHLGQNVRISADHGEVGGTLSVPPVAKALVIFVHGSGSSRFSRRNQLVADALNQRGFATLLMDLLTLPEERVDQLTREYRFDINLLAGRVVNAIDWAHSSEGLPFLPIGLFGASTGAAAALVAAEHRPGMVSAIVSRGGRPDLAGNPVLKRVDAPTLFIVGSHDEHVLALNEGALEQLMCEKRLEVVPGATHLFEEPGALERVCALAGDWFATHLVP